MENDCCYCCWSTFGWFGEFLAANGENKKLGCVGLPHVKPPSLVCCVVLTGARLEFTIIPYM